MIERVPLLLRLTPQQELVAIMCGHGHNYHDIAERLCITPGTVRVTAKDAAAKIPGDMPAQMRLICWIRGAPLYVLDGSWLLSIHPGYGKYNESLIASKVPQYERP